MGPFAILAVEGGTSRILAENGVPPGNEELPAGLAHLLETQARYAEAHLRPHSDMWTRAELKEMEGLHVVGTFAEAGGT